MFKKQQFPDSVLQSISNNASVYAKGKKLQLMEYFGQPYFIQSQNAIEFETANHEQVTIEFLKNGIASTYSCTCSDFNDFSGACQHVIGAMLELNEYTSQEINELAAGQHKQDTKISSGLMDHSDCTMNINDQVFESLIQQSKKQKHYHLSNVRQPALAFEFVLNFSQSRQGNFLYHFYLRVGTDYLYVIKADNMIDVIESLLEGNSYHFGKKLTFQSDHHVIRQSDRQVLEILRRAGDFQPIFKQDPYDYHYTDAFRIHLSLVNDLIQALARTEYGFIRLGELPMHPSHIDHKFPVTIAARHEKLPLHFIFEKSADGYQLNYPNIDEVFEQYALIHDLNLFVYDHIFKYFDREDTDILLSMLTLSDELDEKPLQIPENQLSEFATYLLPILEKYFNVTIDRSIPAQIYRAKCQPILKIDYESDSLLVNLEFEYGENSLNALELFEDNWAAPHQQATDKIIIRDVEKESAAYQLVSSALSDVDTHAGQWVIDDLFEIAKFIYDDIPIFEQDMNIYLTVSAENIFYGGHSARPKMLIERNTSTNLLDISFQMPEIPPAEVSGLLNDIKKARPFYRLNSGKIVDLRHKDMQGIKEAIDQINLNPDDLTDGELSVGLYQGFSLYEDEVVETGENFRALIEKLGEGQNLHFELPSHLHAELRPYQVKGYHWLRTLDQHGFGAVLADDMGLGKTVQTIAFVAGKVADENAKSLVIVPSSVLFNWAYEFERFAPSISVSLIEGDISSRQKSIKAALSDQSVNVIITSYPLIQRDIGLYRDYHFDTIILDESQNVKNATAKTTKAVRALSRKNVLALSGTPIENNLSELWSLFSIVQPGLFPSYREFNQLQTEDIAKKVNFFILRRLKADVLSDLPPKTESIERTELSEEQKKLYQAQLSVIRHDIDRMIDEDTFNQHRIEILAGMTRLRQICNDPRLIMTDYQGESAKLNRLIEYLEEANANGKRVVIFSQFTKMLAIIQYELEKRQWDFHYLDGQTPKEDRLTLSKRFNEGEKDFFLISLRAGGTGLNLTGGDTVLLYDSWWNPAVEDQAADRVHRFGQKKPVQVVRFITNGTIEEKISELQDKKRELIDSVIHANSEKSLMSLTKEDILSLLS